MTTLSFITPTDAAHISSCCIYIRAQTTGQCENIDRTKGKKNNWRRQRACILYSFHKSQTKINPCRLVHEVCLVLDTGTIYLFILWITIQWKYTEAFDPTYDFLYSSAWNILFCISVNKNLFYTECLIESTKCHTSKVKCFANKLYRKHLNETVSSVIILNFLQVVLI
jgi:hypothetical protein